MWTHQGLTPPSTFTTPSCPLFSGSPHSARAHLLCVISDAARSQCSVLWWRKVGFGEEEGKWELLFRTIFKEFTSDNFHYFFFMSGCLMFVFFLFESSWNDTENTKMLSGFFSRSFTLYCCSVGCVCVCMRRESEWEVYRVNDGC